MNTNHTTKHYGKRGALIGFFGSLFFLASFFYWMVTGAFISQSCLGCIIVFPVYILVSILICIVSTLVFGLAGRWFSKKKGYIPTPFLGLTFGLLIWSLISSVALITLGTLVLRGSIPWNTSNTIDELVLDGLVFVGFFIFPLFGLFISYAYISLKRSRSNPRKIAILASFIGFVFYLIAFILFSAINQLPISNYGAFIIWLLLLISIFANTLTLFYISLFTQSDDKFSSRSKAVTILGIASLNPVVYWMGVSAYINSITLPPSHK